MAVWMPRNLLARLPRLCENLWRNGFVLGATSSPEFAPQDSFESNPAWEPAGKLNRAWESPEEPFDVSYRDLRHHRLKPRRPVDTIVASCSAYTTSRGFAGRVNGDDDVWDGGETMATEMIRYSNSHKQKATYDEALRILEHGLSFLLRDGSSETAAGRVLLNMANIEADRGRFQTASALLEQAANLCSASPEIRVAAYEALSGLSLLRHEDKMARRHAKDAVYMAEAAERGDWSQGGPDLLSSINVRGLAAVGLVEQATGRTANASNAIAEADAIWDGSECTGGLRNSSLASAKLAHGEVAHSTGQFGRAEEMYNQALQRARDAGEPATVIASVMMLPEEVAMAAQAGLGQLALHKGKFEEAEAKLTEALKQAERICGEKHPKVGVILSLVAQVYAERAKAKGTGEGMIAEGLYRSAIDILKGNQPTQLESAREDYVDVLALTRARCGRILGWAKGREAEAEKLSSLALDNWQGPPPIEQVLDFDLETSLASQQAANQAGGTEGSTLPTGRFPVVDVRFGRVLV